PILTLSRIFCSNSSKTPTRTSVPLLIYNLTLFVAYSAILTLRFLEGYASSQFTVNNVVIYLHLICYIAVFLSNVISNWVYSKKYHCNLIRLEIFDHNLDSLGVVLNRKKTRRLFNVWFWAALVLFLYVAVVDCVIDLFFTSNASMIAWLSIYVPVTINYFVVFTMVFNFYLLNDRYTRLKTCLDKVLTQDSSITIKQFTDFYLELTHISDCMVGHFSSQIATMFLLVFMVVTSNLYIFLKHPLKIFEYVFHGNFLLMHLAEMVVVIFAAYWTILKQLKCYLLINENRPEMRVFGMFSLNPSTLLSMGASIVSYLIILIQFTENKKNV
ncbi:unnamed protein product, partial [Tenebrio molitor]